jgi:aminopeptidase
VGIRIDYLLSHETQQKSLIVGYLSHLGGTMFTPEFEQNLNKYAEIAIRVGLNLQPGQRLLIGSPMFDGLTPIEAAPLVRLITAHAYRAGAKFVDVLWGDDELKSIRLKEAARNSLEEYPTWQVNAVVEYLERGDALLMIYAHNPDLLQGHDPEVIGMVEQAGAKHTVPIMDYIARNAVNWLVISAPVAGWGAKVFPDLAPANQDARLWDTLFEICRIKQENPIAAWYDHVDQLNKRSTYLNQKQYAALRFRGPGTDLTIGLPAGHLWKSGRITNAAGIPFIPNIPTEEVFTLPHRDKTEGVVTATKPLSFGGGLVEKFSATFAEGKVVKITADKGEENFRQLLETDPGAGRLGEVALVPHSSPISRSGLIFYNILIDENAASHIALGHAYKFSLDKGETLSDEEFAAAGGNLSSIHLDFMIGSGETDVDGLRDDGGVEPIMRAGEWAFRA